MPFERFVATMARCERTVQINSHLKHITYPLGHYALKRSQLVDTCRVKPGKSLITKDRRLYTKTHATASSEIIKTTLMHHIHHLFIITKPVPYRKVNHSEFENTAEIKC